jgi:hypothetical protein
MGSVTTDKVTVKSIQLGISVLMVEKQNNSPTGSVCGTTR